MAMADKNTNLNDATLIDDDTLTTGTSINHGTEPATSHDTKEGGILGAVGGAVVGMLGRRPDWSRHRCCGWRGCVRSRSQCRR